MTKLRKSRILDTLLVGATGGLGGGVAEIAWIALYGATTGTPIDPVVRGVVATVNPAASTTPWSIALGVFIHLGLAVALGVGLMLGLRLVAPRLVSRVSEFGIVVPALAAVWAINFLLVLPEANPAFVHMLPFAVTLTSKLLFGLSAAAVFRTRNMSLERIRI